MSRPTARDALFLVGIAVAMGSLIGLLKGDQAGVLGALGNLVGPWLCVPFACAYRITSRKRAAVVSFAATLLSVISFYCIQSMVYNVYSIEFIYYYGFWAIGGGAACAITTILASFIPKFAPAYVSGWGFAASFWALIYIGYWVTLSGGVDFAATYMMTVIAAMAAFFITGVCALAYAMRHHSKAG